MPGYGLLGITPEPAIDTRAQVRAVRDPRSGKDAAFFAPGTRVPPVPAGLHRIDRPEGTLVTSHGGKAGRFANAPRVDDALMAELLGHAENKADIRRSLAGGQLPLMVQGVAPGGGVAHEALASPGGLAQAAQSARAAAPTGSVRLTSLPAAIARRLSYT